MKNNHNNFVCHLLTLALAIGLMLAFSTTVQAENNFTITIPSTLEVQKPGWNEISGGITATGTLDAGNALVVTASSDNGFKFVNQSDNTQMISYDFCASSTDLTSLTSWSFEKLSSDATTKTVGINVEDYSSKPYGTYTEKVTFTAEIQTPVDLSKLTDERYVAQDGDVLTGTLPADCRLWVAVGATITLKGVSIDVANDWPGITPLTDVTIILEGDNTVTSIMDYKPGIRIDQGYTLTIRGEGSLTVTGGSQAAAIGMNRYNGCGNIVIEGGTITAKGGSNFPGIGGKSCGDITIGQNVTKVTVTAGDNSTSCIGIAKYDDSTTSCGKITIGGTVYYDGSEFQNGGDAILKAESFTYPPEK